MTRLHSLTFHAVDFPLLEPFGIATGAQLVAENVLMRLELEDGTVGWGEAAPVFHISGESRADVLGLEGAVRSALRGRELSDYRATSELLHELCASTKSALGGLEGAVFDALARRAGVSLNTFFGGAKEALVTDVTITTGTPEEAARSARRWVQAGFRELKVKIGGSDLDQDLRRLRAIGEAAPDAGLVLDGNTAFSPQEAVQLIEELGETRSQIVLFEQPVSAEDFEGLARVERDAQVPVAADESLRSRDDFRRILKTGGIRAINLKTAKLGVLVAWDLLVAARAAGLDVMVGGMVESELGMGISACLAAGVGGVRYVDLDTPLLLGERPLRSAVSWGPSLDLRGIAAGHGVTVGELTSEHC